MFGMGGGGGNAQLMQQLYRGGAAGSPDPWAQQTNSLLAAGGESCCDGQHAPCIFMGFAGACDGCLSGTGSSFLHVAAQPLCGRIAASKLLLTVAGYPKAARLSGMQQPALPNLNMASRGGLQPGSAGGNMCQQVRILRDAAQCPCRRTEWCPHCRW